MSDRPALRALAERVGIEAHYESALERRQVEVPDSTLEYLLEALGHEAGDEAAATRSLERVEARGRAFPFADGAAAAYSADAPRAFDVDEALDGARGFGIQANVYALRGGLGHGDLGDLRDLAELTAHYGGRFVAVNPMQAATHAPGDDSPYTPLDRLHIDPIYIDLEQVPELVHAPLAQELLASPEVRALRDTDTIDRPRVWRLKRRVLAALYEAFVDDQADAAIDRERHFDAFREAGGQALRDFATFCAIAEQIEAQRGGPSLDAWDWREWPEALQSPDSAAVERFRDEHLEAIDFHTWMQFEAAHQLEAIDRDAEEMGLDLGLCGDLPLGSRPGGVETWRSPDLFVEGVEVGAPPDEYAPHGQTWGFPPLDPAQLTDAEGQRLFAALLRAAMRHAGALRIDHAMSLRRLFWIPDGAPASEGAYVRYPEPLLLDLLARESAAQQTVLVGEDLGTVPSGFSEQIRERGLLSTRVLYFERGAGGFRPAADYPARALAAANTHDLAPLAGWCGGDDVEMRRSAGQLASDADWTAARAARAAECAALEARLRADDHLAPDEPLTASTLLAASSRFLAATPCALVALSLDDLAGERHPINLPGVPQAVHRSWVRRNARSIDEIAKSDAARAALEAMAAVRG